MLTACGIDFGTSNSTVGVFANGQCVMAPLEGHHTTIPSAIFYPAEGTPPLYGRAAVQAYTAGDAGRLLRSLKSILGDALMDEKTGVGGKYRSFEEILVGFIHHLKTQAETFTGHPLTHVVMGRPVHFVDDNPQADQRAQNQLESIAKKAGFSHVLFQFEPIAAALRFEDNLTEGQTVFIADIGGGTADFSIVNVGPHNKGKASRAADILANEGVHVGGTNLDMRLSLESVMPLLGCGSTTHEGHPLPNWPFSNLATWHRIHTIGESKNMALFRQILHEASNPALFQRYLHTVHEQLGHLVAKRTEDAKMELSNGETTTINLQEVEPGLAATATRTGFQQAITTELEKITDTVAATLRAANLKPEQVSTLFLTGGTSAVPAVRRALAAPFPNAQAVEGDLFQSVGHGLALDAARRFA